jgi:hypothetical protein
MLNVCLPSILTFISIASRPFIWALLKIKAILLRLDLYTSSLNRTIAGLSGSKAGLTQADAQYKEAKSIMRNKSLFEKG